MDRSGDLAESLSTNTQPDAAAAERTKDLMEAQLAASNAIEQREQGQDELADRRQVFHDSLDVP